MIKFLQRNEIDETKWNALIAKHPSGLPYAFSWYLDAVTKNWSAFVLDDYEAVMPLPVAKKFGISYVYQPPMCQQLGVFSLAKSEALTKLFYATLNKKFIRYHVAQNAFFEPAKGFTTRVNFEIELQQNITEISTGYTRNTKYNISKASKRGLRFSDKITPADFSEFVAKYSNDHFVNFEKLLFNLQQNNYLFLCGVQDEKGEWQAVDLCAKTPRRIINLVTTTSPEGMKNGATHLLLHSSIERFCNQAEIFDFEGSTIPGVAQLYRSFGAGETIFFEKRRLVRSLIFSKSS